MWYLCTNPSGTKELKRKTCRAFGNGVDVYLTENDRVIPDAMIVCNKNIIKSDGVHGAPDLIAEVLSPSTAKRDIGYKKDLYEKSLVKEYWIVEPNAHTIEVYHLFDGRYQIDGFYALYPESATSVTDKEKAESRKVIPVSLYNDFSLPLEEIFCDLI